MQTNVQGLFISWILKKVFKHDKSKEQYFHIYLFSYSLWKTKSCYPLQPHLDLYSEPFFSTGRPSWSKKIEMGSKCSYFMYWKIVMNVCQHILTLSSSGIYIYHLAIKENNITPSHKWKYKTKQSLHFLKGWV